MSDPHSSTIPTLLGDALQGITNLIRGEMSLAKAELSQSVNRAGTGIALIVAATVLGITALNVAAGAIVAALVSAGLSATLASVVVTALFALGALILAMAGVKSLKSAGEAPERVAKNLRRDANTLMEIVPNDTDN